MARGPIRVTRKPNNVAAKAPREPLFYLPDPNGEGDVEFTIPIKIPPKFVAQYLQDMRTLTAEQAIARMLDRLLGKEAIDALAKSDDIDEQEMAQLFAVIGEKTTAAMEAYNLGN